MRHLPVTSVKAGTLAKHGVIHEGGQILIAAGETVTERHLAGLKAVGIEYVYLPDGLDDVASFAFERRHVRVDLRQLTEGDALPYDLFDAAEALLAPAGTPVALATLRKLEEFAKSGLYRERSARECRAQEAELFLKRFPLPPPKPLTDSAFMRQDQSRHDREAEIVAKVKSVSNGSILVAEDVTNVRRILVQFLESAGFAVQEATDGQHALDLARKGNFSLILLDVMMPKVDGFEVLRRLKSAPRPPKIILCTAKSSREDVLTGLKAGADDYVVKPFSRKTIIEKVARVFAADTFLNERRRAPRRDTPISVTWTAFDAQRNPVEVRARVRNLSELGLSFENPAGGAPPSGARHDVPVAHLLYRFARANPSGTPMKLSLDLGAGETLPLSGRVVRLESAGMIEIVGVEFDPSSPHVRDSLRRFLGKQ